MLTRLITAAALTAALSTAAQAYTGRPDILPELPANAPPGECYAKVKVPGERVVQPPMTQGAQWVMVPGPPGSAGPIWCLVPTGGQPVAYETPARYGWIRVLCEDDMTPSRISSVQRSLHQRGYYRGEVSGRYDRQTAAALSQFQASQGLNHGGYLSYDSVQALDGGSGYYAQGGYAQGYASDTGYSYAARGYEAQGYDSGWQVTQGAPIVQGYGYAGAQAYAAAPSYGYGSGYQSYQGGYPGYSTGYPCVQACLPPPPPPPPPCCVPPPCCTGYGYPQGGYYGGGYSGYGYSGAYSSSSAVQGGWLNWPGKPRY